MGILALQHPLRAVILSEAGVRNGAPGTRVLSSRAGVKVRATAQSKDPITLTLPNPGSPTDVVFV